MATLDSFFNGVKWKVQCKVCQDQANVKSVQVRSMQKSVAVRLVPSPSKPTGSSAPTAHKAYLPTYPTYRLPVPPQLSPQALNSQHEL